MPCAVVRPASRSGARVRWSPLGELVGVGAGVDGVQHGQLGVVDRPLGVVEGVGRVRLRPRPRRRRPCWRPAPGPLVDLGLDVVHLGGGVGPHLRQLAACAVGGLVGPLLCPLLGVLGVLLGLVDSLPELLTGLGGGSLHRRLGRRDALLELIDSCGKSPWFLLGLRSVAGLSCSPGRIASSGRPAPGERGRPCVLSGHTPAAPPTRRAPLVVCRVARSCPGSAYLLPLMVGLRAVAWHRCDHRPAAEKDLKPRPTATCGGAVAGAAAGTPRRSTNAASQGCVPPPSHPHRRTGPAGIEAW